MSDLKVKIAANGPSLSRIVAGVMSWGVWGKKYSTADIQGLIEKCVSLGITTFDHHDLRSCRYLWSLYD